MEELKLWAEAIQIWKDRLIMWHIPIERRVRVDHLTYEFLKDHSLFPSVFSSECINNAYRTKNPTAHCFMGQVGSGWMFCHRCFEGVYALARTVVEEAGHASTL